MMKNIKIFRALLSIYLLITSFLVVMGILTVFSGSNTFREYYVGENVSEWMVQHGQQVFMSGLSMLITGIALMIVPIWIRVIAKAYVSSGNESEKGIKVKAIFNEKTSA
ncbi:MAG: hypothetical protein QM500_17505 [Methylococcales bacterium]